MSLILGDNFSYQGAKPLDGRIKYDTLADMKAVADATMYEGCLCYCVASDKTYQWKSANTVDETTGKWREFSSGGGGGGGASNLSDLGDVNLDNLSDGQVLGYEDGQWVNKDAEASGGVIQGYAYESAGISTPKAFIDAVNEQITGTKITVSNESILNDLSASYCACVISDTKSLLIFSDVGFDISIQNNGSTYAIYGRSQSSESIRPFLKTMDSQRTISSNFYQDTFPNKNSYTALMSDLGKSGTHAFILENVSIWENIIPESTTTISSGRIDFGFYKDSAHTQLITPTVDFMYVDIPTDDQYIWNNQYIKLNNGGGSGGGGATVSGYAYAKPIESMEEFITRVNALSGFDPITYSSSVFSGKTANSICVFTQGANYLVMFSEYGFDIDGIKLSSGGSGFRCAISRKTLDGTAHSAYRASATMATQITSLTSVTIAADWESDSSFDDNSTVGKFFVTSDVGFNERHPSSAYNQNTYILDGIQFYSDAEHTQLITPEMGKDYVDIATGDIYKWDGRNFSVVGSGGSVDTSKLYTIDDTAETAIDDADYFPFYDSSASTKKKSLWSNIKSVLKTYFDTLYDLNKKDIPMYATSSTAASTTAKTAAVERGTFSLVVGAKVSVRFTYTNTASAPTLNVGSTGAKNIKYINASGNVDTPTVWWLAGDVVTFVYDGTQWLMMPTLSMVPSLPVMGTFSKGDLYSTSEKIIGCWTDGRPLYQKTISFTIPARNVEKKIWSTSNISLKSSEAYLTLDGNNIPYPFFGTTASGYSLNISEYIFGRSDGIYVNNNCTTSVVDGCTAYATIRYTKTTDSTNSYNYASENDYSTSEKIIGTWIDGKTLYQKTINFGTGPNATTKTVNHGISGLNKVVGISSIADMGSGSSYLSIQVDGTFYNADSTNMYITCDKTNITVITTYDATNVSIYVTLKYTKS